MSRVLIAAGGTGGHVYPALALADELRRRGHELAFVGGDRMETRVVPEAGFRLHQLPARALPRRVSLEMVVAGIAFLRARIAAGRLVRRLSTEIVVGMGGYPSLAPSLAAGRRGIPLVLHEQNAMLSLANRLSLRRASLLALSLPLADPGSTRAVRIEHVGNPLREPIRRLAQLPPGERSERRRAAAARFDLDPKRFTLLAFGGSLGARALNEALPQALGGWGSDLQILHVSGPEHFEDAKRRWAGTGIDVSVHGYVDAMEDAYAVADLACTRAGASTVSELTAAGLPAVLVPFPFAPGNVQSANAAVLEGAGAGVRVMQSEPDFAGRLGGALRPLVEDADRRARMAAAARALGRPDAAAHLATLVEALAG